jgi:hypothetical protein
MSGAEGQRGRSVNMQELLFGAFLIALAAGTLLTIRSLSMGSAGAMGPGYVPRAIAFGLLGFGAVLIGRAFFVSGGRMSAPLWRSLLIVPASVAVFALLLMSAGLGIASFGSMVVAALASRETRLKETVIFAAALSAGAVLLFVKVLALPVPGLPW